MNRDVEELESQLQAALQAKSQAVTAPMLRRPPIVAGGELTASEPEFDPNRSEVHVLDLATLTSIEPSRRQQARWLAPALAAAAVIALAVGAAAAVNANRPHHPAPNPPATGVRPPVPSPSRPAPTVSNTVTGPAVAPYLGAGQTGTRAEVPWSLVGAGWRLVQPETDEGGLVTYSNSLYLYDPAGGRYLITDQLPRLSYFQAWSPDGQRAMFRVDNDGDYSWFRELDLHSGQLDAGFRQYLGSFVTYTQPRGLGVIIEGEVQGTQRLLRYGTDGTLQLAYPPTIAGQQLYTNPVLYTDDGSQFVARVGNNAVLLSNSGQLLRQYPLPGSGTQECRPVRWWTSDSLLESCVHPGGSAGSVSSLYVQPTAGGTPSLLVDAASTLGMGYSYGWPLSNGDVVLARTSGCGSGGYDVLHPDGGIVALRLPAGVPAPGTITNLSGDLATFRVVHGCGNPGPDVSLIDYNMVTGATSTLLHSSGTVIGYPGD